MVESFSIVPFSADRVGRLLLDSAGSNAKYSVLSYMDHCPIVLSARMTVDDEIDPSLDPIPVMYFTDGSWIWSAEVYEYVQRHDMELPSEFVTHVLARNSEPPVVSDDRRHEALVQLTNPTGVATA